MPAIPMTIAKTSSVMRTPCSVDTAFISAISPARNTPRRSNATNATTAIVNAALIIVSVHHPFQYSGRLVRIRQPASHHSATPRKSICVDTVLGATGQVQGSQEQRIRAVLDVFDGGELFFAVAAAVVGGDEDHA